MADRIGVSVDDLTAALKGFRLLASTDNHGVLPGDVQDPVDAGETLFATLTRMAAHREPEPGTTRTPRFTGELATAIAQLGPVRVRVENYTVTSGEVDATILYPGTIAGRILQALRQEPEDAGEARLDPGEMPSRFEDPEVDAIAAIVDRLAVLECETDAGTVERVARYLAARYGIEG